MLKVLALLFLGLIIFLPPSVFSAIRQISFAEDKKVFLVSSTSPVENLRLKILGIPLEKVEIVNVQNSVLTPLDPSSEYSEVELRAIPIHQSLNLNSYGEAFMSLKLIRGPLSKTNFSGPLNAVISIKVKQNNSFYLLPVVVEYQL